ncbi:MAG: hypothetical protein NVSMB25_09230 [Thermoleophilaceae bacterium]
MRPAAAIASTLVLALAQAAPALAAKNGEGFAGETNDKVVTIVSLGLVLFFTLVIILGSVIQAKLDKRKSARTAARSAQRVGW